MERGIRHFMWGYQPHFRIGQELQAQRLFRTLDSRFDPDVFLVGVLTEERDGRCPACVEPEDDFWIPSEAFDGVLSRARTVVPTYPESQIWNSHPLAKKWHEEGLKKRAIQDSIREVLGSHPDRPESMAYYPSWPVELEGFLVLKQANSEGCSGDRGGRTGGARVPRSPVAAGAAA